MTPNEMRQLAQAAKAADLEHQRTTQQGFTHWSSSPGNYTFDPECARCWADRYAAALLDAAGQVERLREALEHVATVQGDALARLRAEGTVFWGSPGFGKSRADMDESERWEDTAFWLYTALADSTTAAIAALADEKEATRG